MTAPILSPRMALIPMTPSFLRASLSGQIDEAERELGAALPGDWPNEALDVLGLRLQQLDADPTLQPWLLRAIVLHATQVMIGHIGFHEAPGADRGGEFGFTVFPDYRRQGYAHEASLALMHWARESMGLTKFTLSISPENAPSQALAARLGFIRIGSQMDEIDGLEDVLEYRERPAR